MIAYLEGSVNEIGLNQLVVDVNGVGYGVFLTTTELSQVKNGQKIKLYVHEHIREQSHDLFGFLSKTSQDLFRLLIEVNGVGPKMALAILGIAHQPKLTQAIADGDTKFISQANGVGKRVAERIVVDLKDKVGVVGSDQATDFLKHNKSDEAHQALAALGFSESEASQALSGIDKKLPVEEKVKLALKYKK